MKTPLSLCETFEGRAHWTWDKLAKAYSVGSQLQEESITDFNILEFVTRHPTQIYTYTFSKRVEGINGADWEWWFTSSRRNIWLGFRIQAKVIDLRKSSFPHLHYHSNGVFQSDKLLQHCLTNRPRTIPLYCFYTFWPTDPAHDIRLPCLANRESFGASLVSALSVRYLRELKRSTKLHSLVQYFRPWSTLVCRDVDTSVSLPHRVCMAWRSELLSLDNIIYSELTSNQRNELNRRNISDYRNLLPDIAPIDDNPPSYVLDVIEGGDVEQPDPDLAHVTVFREQ